MSTYDDGRLIAGKSGYGDEYEDDYYPDQERRNRGSNRRFENERSDRSFYPGVSRYEDSRSSRRGDRERRNYSGYGPKNHKRSDERICDDICEGLSISSDIDANNIDVSVKDSVVTLSGDVSDKWMKYHAEDLAENVRGVSEVRNEISVSKKSEKFESEEDYDSRFKKSA